MPFGLSLFYSGMVRKKNAVATIYKSVAASIFVCVFWIAIGHSLAFSTSNSSLIGNFDLSFLNSIANTSESLYLFLFQMGFAILAPSIMVGSIVERINLNFWLVFSVLWSLFVYVPVAYWTWNSSGFLSSMGVVDFAGGNVVHMTSGFSSLVLAIYIGRRKDFFSFRKSHNLSMVVIGTILLMLGWFGFNAGSAEFHNTGTALIIGNTFLCAVGSFIGWFIVDMLYTPRRPTLLGALVSIIVGLVTITPAANGITLGQALLLGMISGLICHLGLRYYRAFGKVDDSLEVFITHGLASFIGAIGTGVLVAEASLKTNMLGAAITAVYSLLMTAVLFKLLGLVLNPRVSTDKEESGLDKTFHGEEIVHLNN
ncbi:MAG: ammonium transporter [Bacteriovoracaceae bacterium]|nr:ammonium transporter [Bacteriovoracaceae bacterium]